LKIGHLFKWTADHFEHAIRNKHITECYTNIPASPSANKNKNTEPEDVTDWLKPFKLSNKLFVGNKTKISKIHFEPIIRG